MENRPLYSMFPHLYQLSSLRNHLVAMILPHFGNSLSPSLWFRRSLPDSEMTDVLALLSLLEEFCFSQGRGMFAFGVISCPKAFHAIPSFGIWLVPPCRVVLFFPLRER